MQEGIRSFADIEERTRSFLRRHSHTLGGQIISLLREHPGQTFILPELSRLIHGHAGLEELSKTAFRPIPLADKKAQAQYIERCRKLIAQKAAGARDPDIDWELDFLTRELRRITRPRGGIKSQIPELDRAYHNLYTCVWKLLRKARRDEPEVHAHLKAHLRYGANFCWLE